MRACLQLLCQGKNCLFWTWFSPHAALLPALGHDLHAYKYVYPFLIKHLLKLALVCAHSLVLIVNALKQVNQRYASVPEPFPRIDYIDSIVPRVSSTTECTSLPSLVTSHPMSSYPTKGLTSTYLHSENRGSFTGRMLSNCFVLQVGDR